MAGQDNWLCDFSCWRFHLPRQGVKPIIFARPYLLSHVQLGAGSRGKQARLTLHAFHRCQPSNLPEWDRSAEKVGHQLKSRDQNVSCSLHSCVKLCHFKCTLFGCHHVLLLCELCSPLILALNPRDRAHLAFLVAQPLTWCLMSWKLQCTVLKAYRLGYRNSIMPDQGHTSFRVLASCTVSAMSMK